jgi:hypothetical protein
MSDAKPFASMAARCAIAGWHLWRSDAADGPVRYFLGKWGLVHVAADLDEVERFLVRAGVA